MSDTIDIDHERLKEFLGIVGRWANVDNASLRLLLGGAVVHMLALLASCRPLPEDLFALYPNEWADEAKSLTHRAMTPLCPSPKVS
jgi:hypothetical protein